jgi:putative salt-induced outer membrane protein YdiY
MTFRLGHRFLVAWLSLVVALPAAADTLYLRDGSVVRGSLQTLGDGNYRFDTDFAGELEIPQDRVTGVTTDEPHTVTLGDGDELAVRLIYDPADGQQLISERFGVRALPPQAIAAVRDLGAPDPALAAAREKLARDPWSGRFAFGLAGSSGNSDSRSINARVEALREINGDRLNLSLRAFRQRDDGNKTEDETIGRARLERDFTERFFLFGETEAERDRLENIDLRFRATLGPGYFFLRGDDHELKGRLGFGYLHEAFVDGGNESGMVVTFGYDYLLVWRNWFRFTHQFTVIPQIDDRPSENFRVDSLLGGEFPLGDGSLWRLRAEYGHQYDNNPEPGIEELDTAYLLNIVRDFE